MQFRAKFCILLLSLGLISALLPKKDNSVSQLNPDSLLKRIQSGDQFVTVDQVARYLVNEDSTVQLIDLRTPVEYKSFNVPGSINIPFAKLLDKDYSGYLGQPGIRNIYYSNGDIQSAEAWTLTQQAGYPNGSSMLGGLNEWFRTIMLSEFKGEAISPKENALFEVRYKARRLFTQMNSLPDSLKANFLSAKTAEQRKLVGGCE
jgi:rhodanese-related sulfurtransferase